MLSKTRAFNLLSEFTDFVLEDETRGSIVVSVDKKYFSIINYELKKLGYKLVYKTSSSNLESFTLVFVIAD
jgi:hypothetical protein